MKTLTSIGLAAGLVFSLTAANATPVLEGTTTDPTGINDLVVDGTTYDVTFSIKSYNALFPLLSPPTFEGNSTGAKDASNALAAALLAANVTSLDSPGTDCITFAAYCTIITPYNLTGSTLEGPYVLSYDAAKDNAPNGVFDWTGGIAGEDTNTNLTQGQIFTGENRYHEYAVYSVVGASSLTVPEPLTLGLFGTGLGALFMLRRRANRQVS